MLRHVQRVLGRLLLQQVETSIIPWLSQLRVFELGLLSQSLYLPLCPSFLSHFGGLSQCKGIYDKFALICLCI